MNIDRNIALPDNPYIIGRPIYEPECFFGREDLFRFIQDNLKQSVKIILLHGQRRIGKSSVLSQIPNFVRLDEFVFIPLSLQGKSQKPLSDILQDLYVDITDYLRDELGLSVDRIIPPSSKDFQENQQKASDSFLTQVYQALAGKNPVLLLDEFDVLDGEGKDVGINQFFSYLKSFVDKHKQLFIIPVVGRRLEDMNTLVLGLFREAPKWEIGLLNERYAKRLIVEPAKGVLEYNPDAIQAILELSAGHPYFTQVLCFAIFSAAREDGKSQVNRADVERIVDKAIEFSEGGLAWFRNGLPIPEKVVFSAVAEAQKIAQLNNNSVGGEPLTLLEEYGVVQTEELVQASRRLVEWGFLDLAEGSDLPLVKVPKYKVKIELVRRWLVKQYPLREEIRELEKLDLEANSVYEAAIKLGERGDKRRALSLYEQVLFLNPNHFSTLFELAEGYLDNRDYDKALGFYKRAYQVDPIRNKESYLALIQNRNNLNVGNINPVKTLDIPLFYKAINPSKPLMIGKREEQKYYIDFSSVRGNKIVESLKRTIALISPDQPTCQLFTGHIGCGKSTELLRLKDELEEEGFHVVYFESSQDLDMTDVDITDILLSIVREVSDSLAGINIKFKSGYFSNLLTEIKDFFPKPIKINTEAEISITLGEILAKTKESFKVRQQLRQYLEPRTGIILKGINNEFFSRAITELKLQGKAGLVVIVDNLDRVANRSLPSGRSLPEYLFIDRGDQLQKLKCHVIYTIPLSLMFSDEVEIIKNHLGGGVPPKILSMIPIRQRDGSEFEESMALLRQMVMARAFPNHTPTQRLDLITEVFDTPKTLDRLCQVSGGHLRNLLGLLYSCLRQEDPPISHKVLENAIGESRNYLTASLERNDWDLLFNAIRQQIVKTDVEHIKLLRGMFVYEYRDQNGSWFDINPVLKETEKYQSWLKKQEKLRQATNNHSHN